MLNENAGRITSIKNPRLKKAANAENYCIREHLTKYLQLPDWQKKTVNDAIKNLYSVSFGGAA